MSNRLSSELYIKGVLASDKSVLGRAITLVESNLPADRILAAEVLEGCAANDASMRIGISGSPGVGKSTFIDAIGKRITGKGHKVAVLAVDPSSPFTKGSILGDKTRMDELSRDPLAFIRPSPAGGTIGGVTRRTREGIQLCEAAGYEYIIVETVGVGQSEIAVHSMVDLFLLLMMPGAGDDLQGIKKGIMEMADLFVINKADGDNLNRARSSRNFLSEALRILKPAKVEGESNVLTCSALNNEGIKEVLDRIEKYRTDRVANGSFISNRNQQRLDWFHDSISTLLQEQFISLIGVEVALRKLETEVLAGNLTPTIAAEQLLDQFFPKNDR